MDSRNEEIGSIEESSIVEGIVALSVLSVIVSAHEPQSPLIVERHEKVGRKEDILGYFGGVVGSHC